MSNVFDYVKSISSKDYIEDCKNYNPYLTNIALSYFVDTIMYANEMNRYHALPPKCQYDFLFHTIRAGKRFSKWFKPEQNDDVELIMNYYQYSRPKALEALQVLTTENLNDIRKEMETT